MSMIGLVEEVVSSLNVAFTEFTAVKAFTPEYDLADNEDLKVNVVPFETQFSGTMNRASSTEDSIVARISIAQRIEKDGEETVLDIVQRVFNHFKVKDRVKLSGPGGDYVRNDVNLLLFYDYKTLSNAHQVISVVDVGYTEFTI